MNERPPLYERRLQLKHFYDDRTTGQTRRTWLEIQLQIPEKTAEGWVNEGKIRLSIGEERDVRAAFLLSISEAARLIKTLETAVEDHDRKMTQLWKE